MLTHVCVYFLVGGLAMVVVGEEEDGEELTVIKPGQTDFTLEAGEEVKKWSGYPAAVAVSAINFIDGW
jgi:hypothetical protein